MQVDGPCYIIRDIKTWLIYRMTIMVWKTKKKDI